MELRYNMKVTNLLSTSGNKVANQFEIDSKHGLYFQSYDTMIAFEGGFHLVVSKDYNYSNTTNRYFGQWLRGSGWDDSEIKALKKNIVKHNTGDTWEQKIGSITHTITYVNDVNDFTLAGLGLINF